MGNFHHRSRVYILVLLGRIRFFQIDQIFNISFRSFYRRIGQSQNGIPVLQGEVQYLLNDFDMYRFIPNNALLSDLFPSGFKLGFNQANCPASIPKQRANGGKIKVKEIKDTSTLKKSTGSGTCSVVR